MASCERRDLGYLKQLMATRRENPGLKVKLFVGYMKNPTKLKGAKGIRRSPKMCQELLSPFLLLYCKIPQHQDTP